MIDRLTTTYWIILLSPRWAGPHLDWDCWVMHISYPSKGKPHVSILKMDLRSLWGRQEKLWGRGRARIRRESGLSVLLTGWKFSATTGKAKTAPRDNLQYLETSCQGCKRQVLCMASSVLSFSLSMHDTSHSPPDFVHTGNLFFIFFHFVAPAILDLAV